jgi:hypothetical protein
MRMESTFAIRMLTISLFNAVDNDLREVATKRLMFQNIIDAHSLISPDLQFMARPARHG